MKFKHSYPIFLCAVGLVAARAEETKISVPGLAPAAASAPAAPAAAEPAKPSFTDAQLVEEFGWFIGKRVGLTELEFGKGEIDSLLKGIASAASGKDSPFDLDKIGPLMDEFMQKKQGAYMAKLKEKNCQANTAFFAKLKENKNVVELPSGLRYEIVKPGEGAFPKPTETVVSHIE